MAQVEADRLDQEGYDEYLKEQEAKEKLEKQNRQQEKVKKTMVHGDNVKMNDTNIKLQLDEVFNEW